MEKSNCFITGLILGIILCGVGAYFIFIGPSEATVADYRAKQRELEATVNGLRDSVSQRDADIGRLTALSDDLRREAERTRADYSRLESSNRDRQKTIETARRLVEGTDDAVRKLELIIDAFEKLEQSVGH